MAGSHKSGVSAAKVHLFENAFYVFTPDANTVPSADVYIKRLVEGYKSNFLRDEPKGT